MSKEAPIILVKTWLTLARSRDIDPEIKTHALNMLRESIGSPEEIMIYMKKHNLK